MRNNLFIIGVTLVILLGCNGFYVDIDNTTTTEIDHNIHYTVTQTEYINYKTRNWARDLTRTQTITLSMTNTITDTRISLPSSTPTPTMMLTNTSSYRLLDGTDYDIYSTVIDNKGSDYFVGKPLLISNATDTEKEFTSSFYPTYYHLLDAFPDMDLEVFNDYAAINNISYLLIRRFNINIEYILVNSNGDLQSILDTYPKSHGIIWLSRIGINKIKDQAVLSSSVYCGPICGEIKYYLLMKINDKWSIIKSEVFMNA
jgi:hypothetical protein